MKVAFRASIKEFSGKLLVSGDPSQEILLRFLPDVDVLNKLNQLYLSKKNTAQELVVFISDEENEHD